MMTRVVAVLRFQKRKGATRRYMSEAKAILTRARALGLTLRRKGDRIAVRPARLCTPDLLDTLRSQKRAIMDLLEAETTHLSRDCAPWLHIARQVLAGEFDGADGSTTESLWIGVRNIRHPVCQQAAARLRAAFPDRFVP